MTTAADRVEPFRKILDELRTAGVLSQTRGLKLKKRVFFFFSSTSFGGGGEEDTTRKADQKKEGQREQKHRGGKEGPTGPPPVAKEAKTVLGVEHLDAVADRGYFSGEEILECENAGIWRP